jgi:hypothetical protein
LPWARALVLPWVQVLAMPWALAAGSENLTARVWAQVLHQAWAPR